MVDLYFPRVPSLCCLISMASSSHDHLTCISTLELECEIGAWVGEGVVHPEPYLAGIHRQGLHVLDTARNDPRKEQCVKTGTSLPADT